MATAGSISANAPAGRNAERVPWFDWMVLPTVAVLAVVIGYPVVYTLVLSTKKYNLLDMTPAKFIGGANYSHLFADPVFWHSLGNTAIYTFGSVIVASLLGLALALLTESLTGWRFRTARALLLTPWAPAILFRRVFQRLARIRRGDCPTCGYDLRASVGHCPECGRPVRRRSGKVSEGAAAS